MNFQIWGPSAIVKRSIFVMYIHFRVLCPYVSHYSRGRVLVTKAVLLASMLDDTYDAYATFEELQRLTDAFERWEMNDEDQLSDYLKVVFNSVRTLFDEFDKEMDPERWPHIACYARETVMELIRSYFQEAKWLNAGYVPTFEEYLDNTRKSSVLNLITTISFIGMEGVADEMAFIWLQSFPKIQRSMDTIGRLLDDIRSHELEQTRVHVASGVECYMKEYGVMREEAVEAIRGAISDSWKDVNEELLRPTAVSMHLLTRILNLTRGSEISYHHADDYTNLIFMKHEISAAYVDPIPI